MAFNFKEDLAYLGGAAQATATGTTAASSPIFDISGYEGAVGIQTNVAVTSTGSFLAAYAGTATASLSQIAGTNCTALTSALMLHVHRPPSRYIRFNTILGTSGQLGPLLVFGVGPRAKPTTNSTLLTAKFVNNPATGTATSS